ncbi:MAG TPA: long-chain fatty acid--CoA ligase [Bryobacteraceae bacterium]|jgi:long-chain acyl-CoA synthetase
MSSRTIFQVLEETARLHGNKLALQQPYTENGVRKHRRWTWNEYRIAAEEIAAGLRSLGIGPRDIVVSCSETRAEFYLADLGIMANGSVSAALYPSYPAPDLVKSVGGCDAKALFVENARMRKNLASSPVEWFILLTGEIESPEPGTLTLDQLRERGRAAMTRDPGLLDRITSAVRPADEAILYLTSGATGEPKMVMVTHEAIIANLDMAPEVLALNPTDITVAFLPSAHIAQRVVVELIPIRCAMPVSFAESLMKMPQDIKEVRPTIFLAPPRLWERIYTTICTEVNKRPAVARKVFYAAVALGLGAARYRRAGKPVPWRIRGPLKLADGFVFSKVRERFGGRLRVAASGAAPLGTDLAEFYDAIGMPLHEGYGLTEGGVATLNPIGKSKPGSIGTLLPGVHVRLDEDGQMLLKSPCLFSYYYKDPNGTAEVLRDGWLHTGDVGYGDSDGYWYITGRKKEMIVASNGKKIYPSRLESLFKFELLISQVILIGDRLPFIAALFTINPAVAESLPGMNGTSRTYSDVAKTPAVLQEVQRIVAKVNRQLAPFEQVRKFRVLDRELTIEAGELTATMKVRRTKVLENFKKEVEEVYAGREGAGY